MAFLALCVLASCTIYGGSLGAGAWAQAQDGAAGSPPSGAPPAGPEPVPWPSAERPAYPSSPYHGATDGAGQVIPCRCRFQGRDYRLGEEVCMSTHQGVVLTRCDLLLNNTSWVPTATACTISQAPAPTLSRITASR